MATPAHLRHEKISWNGIHPFLKDSSGRPLCSPLSKLTPAVRKWLCDNHGWRFVDPAHPDERWLLPVFSFTGRKGGDFASLERDRAGCPVVLAQLPAAYTEQVDCKLRLWQHVWRGGHAESMPPTHTAAEFLHMISDDSQDDETLTWFLKHRYGVKGQAVHVFTRASEARAWLLRKGEAALEYFVCQQEVTPFLVDNRKFVVRAHVLLLTYPREELYLHNDCICLPHSSEYCRGSESKAVHISAAGKGHPDPFMLSDLTGSLPDAFDQILDIVRNTHDCVRDHLVPSRKHWQTQSSSTSSDQAMVPRGSITALASPHSAADGAYHLFGYDFMFDATGKAVMLEINANPAVASGTLHAVPRSVFDTMLTDLVWLAVLPHTDGIAPEAGRFVKVYGGEMLPGK